MGLIIESLIRLGRPFLQSGGLSPRDVILQITDVASPQAQGFYKNVLLVEVDTASAAPGFKVVGHPLRSWTSTVAHNNGTAVGGKKRQKTAEIQDLRRAVALPFVLSTGGNPTVRQGYYAVPAYIVYQGSKSDTPGSLQTMAGNADETLRFLESRVSYTIGLRTTPEELKAIASSVAERLPRPGSGGSKTMALIGVVDYRSGVFVHSPAPQAMPSHFVDIGESLLYPRHRILVDLAHVVRNLWSAKMKEAAEKGTLDTGECSFCGYVGQVVSAYAKGWPLFTTTYEFPLPQELSEDELVKSIALCRNCYSALVFGANLFSKSVKTVDRMVTRELFSPTQSGMGKLSSRKGNEKSRKVKDIYGSCYILPVLDEFLKDEETREDFIAGNLKRLESVDQSRGVDVQLSNILGFEDRIAEEISSDNYRLTVVYYGGDWSRGAVDLYAIIQDVVPSVARTLVEICRSTGEAAVAAGRLIAASWGDSSSDARDSYYRSCHSSLPYLLIQAYGGPYLWHCLESVLHRRPLDYRTFVRNVARRMMDLSKNPADSERASGLESEVVFFVSFAAFLEDYQRKVVGQGGVSTVFDWRSWIETVTSKPVSQWEPSSVEEVGFVIGMLIRAFSRQYYVATDGKDFIKHRVMTFGADIRPRDIVYRGLARFSEYGRRLDMPLQQALREWAAAATMRYLDMQEVIRRDSDSFVAAFWAGYELCPMDLFGKQASVTEGSSDGKQG